MDAVMTDTYLNSTPRSCENCRFREGEEWHPGGWMCKRSGIYCTHTMVDNRYEGIWCDRNLKGWAPIPPKPPARSLRQWLYDLLWA